jgi:selenoprotein W-related protein
MVSEAPPLTLNDVPSIMGLMPDKPALSIEYCTVCNFRGRAVWLAQELLAALEQELSGVTLVPARGGVFDVRLGAEMLFSYKASGRFPEPRELKDQIRERLGLDPRRHHEHST